MKPSARAPLYLVLNRLPLLLSVGGLVAIFVPDIPPQRPAHPGLTLEMIGNMARTALLVAGTLALLQFLLAIARGRACLLEVADDGVHLTTGVLRRVHETYAYANLREVVVTRSGLEKTLGLATVVFVHAVGRDEAVRGLRVADAESLRHSVSARIPGPPG